MNRDEKNIINISKNKNIYEKIKGKIGEVLFTQLLPYTRNMIEFQIEKKYIIKVIDNIVNTYNYMNKSHLDAIYNLVCDKKEELEIIKKEMMDDKTLENFTLNKTIIKNVNKNRIDEDDEDDDDDELGIIN